LRWVNLEQVLGWERAGIFDRDSILYCNFYGFNGLISPVDYFSFKKTIIPLLNPAILAGVGLLFALLFILIKQTRWFGFILAVLSLGFLYISSTAIGEMPFLRYLEWKYPRINLDLATERQKIEEFNPDYIVVLGGGNREARATEAARIKKYFPDLKIITTGGDNEFPLSAAATSESLIKERMKMEDMEIIKLPGRDTESEALGVSRYLKENRKSKIILVTGAIHMPRAILFFEAAGVKCFPSPARRQHRGFGSLIADSLIPSISSLKETHLAIREFVGFLWAKFKVGYLVPEPEKN